jgi:hypothetical protein
MGRKRSVTRAEAAVWCPGGRWGHRRTRVNECFSVLSAETVYTEMLRSGPQRVPPGGVGTVTYTLERGEYTASFEIRQNAVWRYGRVFLRCCRCGERCTRLYLPLETSQLACRKCWGLSYASRTLSNYKDSLWGRGWIARMFGTTQRDWAYERTGDRRQARRKASIERWAIRREYSNVGAN